MSRKQNKNRRTASGALALLVVTEQILHLVKTICLMVKRCLPFVAGSEPTVAAGKRNPVVSKSRYLLAVGDRTISLLIGFAFFIFSLLSGLFCVRCAFLLPALLYVEDVPRSNVVAMPGLMVCIPLTYFLWKASQNAFHRAGAVPPVVPLTRANTGHLPASDSLVRAAEEPAQEQQTVLLRAAMGEPQTPPEQLVRAVEGERAGEEC